MKFRKTEKAYWTVVYHEGRRMAEFVKDEFETHDLAIIKVLQEMGYEKLELEINKAISKPVDVPKKDLVAEGPKIEVGLRGRPPKAKKKG